ncbi:MAG: VanZ family protein [Gemmatimonadetes bacterium]|nr:VanZ family protein [Gemmatimonadota bacterium]
MGQPEPRTFSEKLDRSRMLARAAYLGILLLATLSWMRLGGPGLHGLWRMFHPSLSPRDVIDGARNVVLFAGWGLVWMITAPPGRSMTSLRNAVLTGAGVSLFVEGTQLFSSTRTASILDVLTNTVGSLLGAVALVALVIAVARRRRARSFVGIPAMLFAVCYGVSAFGEALVPLFRQTTLPNVHGGPLGRFQLVWSMFTWSSLAHVPLTDILLFAPAGAFAVAALAEAGHGYRKAVAVVAAVGSALGLLAEIAHGLLGLRIDAGAVLAHALGIGGGALVTAWQLPRLTRHLRGRERPGWLLSVYAVVLLLWALRPFALETSLSAIGAQLTDYWWIPLRFLGQRVDLFSVVDVVSPFFLYVPFGALLAVWPLARRGALADFWPAVYVAAATELLQIFVQGRLLDSTDLLVQAAGALVGWAVMRRAGFTPYGSVLRR